MVLMVIMKGLIFLITILQIINISYTFLRIVSHAESIQLKFVTKHVKQTLSLILPWCFTLDRVRVLLWNEFIIIFLFKLLIDNQVTIIILQTVYYNKRKYFLCTYFSISLMLLLSNCKVRYEPPIRNAMEFIKKEKE